NLKKVFKRTKLKLKKTKLVRYIVYGFTIISIALVYFMPESAIDPIFKYFAYSMIFFIFSTFFIWVVVKSIEEVCMIKKVAPEKLTEGDWIVKDIKIDGKRICGPKDLGIERKQIDQLIKFKKQKKITYVTIKNGIPFVPSFLFAFVYTIIFNNIIFLSMIV
ncbi:hypothetical protein HOD20_07955, partial [archaeon]|nr:hypothetical protein [archaeon]